MQRPWWKHPKWIHVYAIFGAIVGAFLFALVNCVLTDDIVVRLLSAQSGMQNINSGLSGAFFGAWMMVYTLALGGLSSFFLIYLFGKYRSFVASIGLIITGIVSILFAIWSAKETMSLMGNRATLANYGGCFIYSLILIICGILILRRKAQSG